MSKDSELRFDNDLLAQRLAAMIRCRTVSRFDASLVDWNEFDKLHALLEATYPLVHATLERKVINGHSLLYRWPAKRDGGLPPILLTAHQDVVPVASDSEAAWLHGAFSGDIADGCVWGRGAIDVKCMILCHMEAVEALIRCGFAPDRDVYLAYGHDEEVSGTQGAQKIAEYLRNLGLRFDFVLDEGGGYTAGGDFGLPDALLAQVGVFEKGYLDVKLTVLDEGGHASRPKSVTALGLLCRAIIAIAQNPFPPSLNAAVKAMIASLLPHLPQGALREAAQKSEAGADGALLAALCQTPKGMALVCTTAAPTMASAAPAPNVLPQKAEAIVNVRIHSAQNIQSVLAHFGKAIGDDRVKLSVEKGNNSSKVSETDCGAYRSLEQTIRSLRPETVVVPSPLVTGTDAVNYDAVSDHVYRFGPFFGEMAYKHTIHAANERMPIDSLQEGATFYAALIRSLCEAGRRAFE